MESGMLETRLGPVAWQSSGRGPALVFFAGALANHDLWRDVIAKLDDHYRCLTVDLPLGSHPVPLAPKQTIAGPAIVESAMTTVLLRPGETAKVTPDRKSVV